MAEVVLVGCSDDLCVVNNCLLTIRETVSLEHPHFYITHLACAPSGSSIAAACGGHLCIVDPRTLEVRLDVRFGVMYITCLTFLSETQIAVGHPSPVGGPGLHIVDVGSGAPLQRFAIGDRHYPTDVARPPHGGFLWLACVEEEDQETGGMYKACLANGGAAPMVERVNDIVVSGLFAYA